MVLITKNQRKFKILRTYLEVVPLGIGSRTDRARVPLPISQVGLLVNFQVLCQVTLLSEALPTELSHVRLDPLMHPSVVQQVTGSQELLATALLGANVDSLLPA